MWLALHVRPNAEKKVQQSLQRLGIAEYLPLERTENRRKAAIDRPLFPGYLFAAPVALRDLQRVAGVLKVVGSVPDVELDGVRKLLTDGVQVEPVPFVHTGETVQVRDGPLAGAIGTVVFVRDRARIVISIELLRRSVAAEVDERWLVKLA